ncbi:MAG: 1-deoxy-D-xylulose-5-phosphate reductoisomerase [Fimbriimonadaceae bacterium]|nr:1-deoxy-D-xylulose-5-phosphate reductoisomerase [Fimbriimonadaceae bacterium]
MKRVAVLGSTGSIGRQTLDIIRQHPDLLQVVALGARSNGELLRQQAQEFGVAHLALFDKVSADDYGVPAGIGAFEALASLPEVDVVVMSVAGVIGLLPTLAAIRARKMVALASKEVLVAAGEVVMPLVREAEVTMTPIDSEHSAVFQCVQGFRRDQIERIFLTASGGPFRGWTKDQLKSVTVEQALNHPTWRMGGKITIDSATLMNKGLEVIEARWLFDVPLEHVEVVVHPQSILHSLVEFRDGSVLGQLGWPNMRLPIQYALLYPERVPNDLPSWRPTDSPQLSFEPVDEDTFRCLRLARDASKAGGTMPAAMNAANEEAANAFLRGEVSFLGIAETVERVMERHETHACTLDGVLETDAWARRIANEVMGVNS